MSQITNAVLNERIKNMEKSITDKIDGIQKSISEIHAEVKCNTEFRLKFKGVIATVSGAAATLGASVFYFFEKLVGNIK